MTTVADVWLASLPTPPQIRRARQRLHVNAVLTALLAVGSYWALVISSLPGLVRAGAAVTLVAACVALGTGVMHDANHGSFSRSPLVNRALSYTMELLGGCSWLWRFKHNHLHHGNPNVVGVDSDIEQAPFARLAPHQPRRPWHRYQHVYLWFLYGFMNLKNLLIGDLRSLLSGRLGNQAMRQRATPAVFARTTAGKVLHLGWAIVLPLRYHSWTSVLGVYVASSWAVGFLLAVVFQLAHCVDRAEFPDPDASRRGEDFVSFQMRTTVDIRSSAPVLAPLFRWLAGGLDHQLEHHLAPRLPHTTYAATAARFRSGCERAGIAAARSHVSIPAALRSHTRWLVMMGRPAPSAG